MFLICNQDHQGEARRFRLGAKAQGVPEAWDAMRNEITAIPFERMGPDTVEFDLTLEPSEAVLVVFRPEARALPARVGPETMVVTQVKPRPRRTTWRRACFPHRRSFIATMPSSARALSGTRAAGD